MPFSSSHCPRFVCSCGIVISQCRCPGLKIETVVPNGCQACQERLAALTAAQAQQQAPAAG